MKIPEPLFQKYTWVAPKEDDKEDEKPPEDNMARVNSFYSDKYGDNWIDISENGVWTTIPITQAREIFEIKLNTLSATTKLITLSKGTLKDKLEEFLNNPEIISFKIKKHVENQETHKYE